MKKELKKLGTGLALSALLVAGAPAASFAADTIAVPEGIGAGLGRAYGNMISVVADFLGMTSDEVRAKRWEGKSIVDMAEEKDVTENQLIEVVTESREANLQDAVQEGTITQEHADLCLDQMEEKVKANLERTSVGRPDWAPGQAAGQGMRRGADGGRGGMGGSFGMRGAWNQQ